MVKVEIKCADYNKVTHLMAWCKDQYGPDGYEGRWWIESHDDQHIFKFDKGADATLFMLKWG